MRCRPLFDETNQTNTTSMKSLAIVSALIAASALHGQNLLTIAADVADGETFTIGSDVFEFTTNNTPTTGRRAVDVSGGLTPATALPAAAAAISLTGCTAIVVGANVVVIDDTPGRSLACSETMAGSGNVWAAAATYGHTKPDTPKVPVQQSRAVIAAEVTAGLFAMGFGGTVQTAAVSVRTAAGVAKAVDGALAISGRIVTLNAAGSTDLAATDVVTITAVLALDA